MLMEEFMRYLVLIGGWLIALAVNDILGINRESWKWYISIGLVYLIFQGMGGFTGNKAKSSENEGK